MVSGRELLNEEFKNEMSIKLARFHSLQIEQPDVKFKTHLERIKSQFEPMIGTMAGMADAAISKIDVPPYKVIVVCFLIEMFLIKNHYNDLLSYHLLGLPEIRSSNRRVESGVEQAQ